MIDLKQIEQEILENKYNRVLMNAMIWNLNALKEKYDWQLNKFLKDFCPGVEGLKELECDTNNPKYRYYNHKSRQYSEVERMIRVASAYI